MKNYLWQIPILIGGFCLGEYLIKGTVDNLFEKIYLFVLGAIYGHWFIKSDKKEEGKE